jgi:T4 RnlA family RNA ligase
LTFNNTYKILERRGLTMKYQFYLPTYEECVAITKANECFYEKQVEVNGQKVSVFNYRLAQYKDFFQPIEGSNVTAFELRGLTFVFNEDGTTKRFLGLHKFFNLNQVPTYQYDEVKGFSIKRVQDKLDGSMIRFLNIGGQLVAKTKMDFTNAQCEMAMACAKNQKLEQFIQQTLDQGLLACFEIVSRLNQIVLVYEKTEIKLLQLRDEKTGEYLDIYSHPLVKEYNVPCAEQEESKTLDYYIEQAKTLEGIEGWVLTLENSQMLKIKTDWYFRLHGLLSENLVRENKILEMVLNETIDDALAQIDNKDPRYKYSEDIQKAVGHYLELKLQEVLALKNLYSGVRKDYALAHKDKPLFSIAVKLLDMPEGVEEKAYAMLKDLLLRKYSGLMDAKEFIKNELKVELRYLENQFDDE